MPHHHRSVALLTLVSLSGYAHSAEPALAENYPSFKVDVQLTAVAQAQLTKSGHKIGVTFEFGTEMGPDSTNMISKVVELELPGVINTETFGFAPEEVADLGDTYDGQVSGYSVSETELNFLDCALVSGSIGDLRGKTHVLACDVLKLD